METRYPLCLWHHPVGCHLHRNSSKSALKLCDYALSTPLLEKTNLCQNASSLFKKRERDPRRSLTKSFACACDVSLRTELLHSSSWLHRICESSDHFIDVDSVCIWHYRLKLLCNPFNSRGVISVQATQVKDVFFNRLNAGCCLMLVKTSHAAACSGNWGLYWNSVWWETDTMNVANLSAFCKHLRRGSSNTFSYISCQMFSHRRGLQPSHWMCGGETAVLMKSHCTQTTHTEVQINTKHKYMGVLL